MDLTAIQLNIPQTVGLAAVFLVVGELIKSRVAVLGKYFIPSPIIGGLLFSILILIGHQTGAFEITLSKSIREFFMVVFFTTIGFSASLELLKKGGLAVLIFLAVVVVLVVLQNIVGVGLAGAMGANPLLGLAAGSISMTGGHGTSGAFGPILENLGVTGALPAAMAASTWGLVFGCLIGGPLGRRLMQRYKVKGRAHTEVSEFETDESEDTALTKKKKGGKQYLMGTIMYTVVLIAIAMGIGVTITDYLATKEIVLPGYLGGMLVAAVMRNIIDLRKLRCPEHEVGVIGEVSLAFFLTMALMDMKLWELVDVAGPLLVILVAQTILMAVFAYYVTFRVMGRDYDAVTISVGHCGFGMGATPNAVANMQAFTSKNGPSPKAFFVIPLVGSLFVDFVNALVITGFIKLFS